MSQTAQALLLVGGLGLGVYWLWHEPATVVHKDKKTVDDNRSNRPINQRNVLAAQNPYHFRGNFEGYPISILATDEFVRNNFPRNAALKRNQPINHLMADIKELTREAFYQSRHKTLQVFGDTRNQYQQVRPDQRFQIVIGA